MEVFSGEILVEHFRGSLGRKWLTILFFWWEPWNCAAYSKPYRLTLLPETTVGN